MLCQSTTWGLQYEVALYVIEIVIMAVTENPAALAVFPVTDDLLFSALNPILI